MRVSLFVVCLENVVSLKFLRIFHKYERRRSRSLWLLAECRRTRDKHVENTEKRREGKKQLKTQRREAESGKQLKNTKRIPRGEKKY